MMDEALLQDLTQMKLDVLSAMHFIAEAWRLITSTIIKNCFVKCGFSIDVSRNGDCRETLSIAYNLLECNLRTSQLMTVLLRFVDSRLLTRC
jgi:hypothetical protein